VRAGSGPFVGSVPRELAIAAPIITSTITTPAKVSAPGEKERGPARGLE